MRVTIQVRGVPGFPTILGPHELSWSYILDFVFADAYHRRLSDLTVVLPAASLENAVRLRAELTPAREGPTRKGVADLAAVGIPVGSARAYSLAFGLIAPASLRRRNPKPETDLWPQKELSVFTWQARAYGLPIRAAALLNRPDLMDRAVFAMRRVFASENHTPAYYHLTTWGAA